VFFSYSFASSDEDVAVAISRVFERADLREFEIDEGLPTVRPSILVADARCLTHFWLTRGTAFAAEQWSEDRVQAVMASQLQSHLRAAEAERISWWVRLVRTMRRLLFRKG
jgi:hypothetical protein